MRTSNTIFNQVARASERANLWLGRSTRCCQSEWPRLKKVQIDYQNDPEKPRRASVCFAKARACPRPSLVARRRRVVVGYVHGQQRNSSCRATDDLCPSPTPSPGRPGFPPHFGARVSVCSVCATEASVDRSINRPSIDQPMDAFHETDPAQSAPTLHFIQARRAHALLLGLDVSSPHKPRMATASGPSRGPPPVGGQQSGQQQQAPPAYFVDTKKGEVSELKQVRPWACFADHRRSIDMENTH